MKSSTSSSSLHMTVKMKYKCLQFAHWPRLPKVIVTISLKYGYEQFGKVPMVIIYCWMFSGIPESKIIMHLYPRWGIIMICRTWAIKVRTNVQLLACFVVGVFLFLWILFLDLAFGWSFGNGGVGYEATSTGMSPLKSLLGEMTAHCSRWKLAFSRARMSFLVRLVPSFTSQMFGTSSLDLIHLRFESFT